MNATGNHLEGKETNRRNHETNHDPKQRRERMIGWYPNRGKRRRLQTAPKSHQNKWKEWTQLSFVKESIAESQTAAENQNQSQPTNTIPLIRRRENNSRDGRTEKRNGTTCSQLTRILCGLEPPRPGRAEGTIQKSQCRHEDPNCCVDEQ